MRNCGIARMFYTYDECFKWMKSSTTNTIRPKALYSASLLQGNIFCIGGPVN